MLSICQTHLLEKGYNISPQTDLKIFFEKFGVSKSGSKKELNKRYEKIKGWEKHGLIYVYFSNSELSSFEECAGYDIDGTLIKPKNEENIFCESDDDYVFTDSLTHLIKESKTKTICLFTNQNKKANFHITLSRVKNVVNEISNKCKKPIYCFLAHDTSVSKPNINMWELAKSFLHFKKGSFFMGDAGGEFGDFSDSDKVFAKNIGINFLRPINEVRPTLYKVPPSDEKTVVLLVGSPASGKTSIANASTDYFHISNDIQKTKALKLFEEKLKTNINIIVDNTFATKKLRDEYTIRSKEKGYKVKIIIVKVSKEKALARNKNRENKVPDLVIHSYYKKYEPPTEDEGEIMVLEN
jgi:DNA 3'-phosphatase